ncbi:hypothetical protein F0562_018627 [Nyssa sinensis]|uniref:BHLH domain-containing protein n=1 Tax=Nyssa sinensis TaxID=561372 RepID=A0A5J4ZDE0_9ASTE|nr:hypothetical protein F0562_018627 [Nyssa sinensis]
MPDTPYPPTPDILNLFHVSRCSSSSFLPNSSFSIPNQTQKSANLAASLGFLGSLSNVFYDPLLHLNLPPQPTLFRELHDPLPHGFNLPGTRAGNLFAGVDEREASGVYQDGDGSHFANGVLEISRDIKLAQKRDGKKTKSFTTERHRREHFNEKFKVLRSLVPNPTKNNRASIVGDAIAYIKGLLRTVDEAEILVEKTRSSRDQRNKRHKTEDDAAGDQIKNSKMMQPLGDPNELTRSWLQRKCKDTEVDVRIVDNETTVKLVQRKKINCLVFVISKALDELQLDLHHVAAILAITTVFCSTPSSSMPGPAATPRSSSHPNSQSSVPPPNRSSLSAISPKITARPEKVGGEVARNSLMHSEEEGPEELNSRNGILHDKRECSSRYYKGLTDSSLAIHRQKLSDSSAGRESHAIAIASRSKSSFIVKMQKWSSLFSLLSKQKIHLVRDSFSSSSQLTEVKTTTIAKELGLERKNASDSFTGTKSALLAKKKPLRERVSEQPPLLLPQPLSLPPLSPLPLPAQTSNEKDTKEMENERVFVWADKYRPVALKDFICNRNKAIELEAMAKADHNCGHFIFEGLPGVGKKTMIWAFLREAFGPDRIKAREEFKEFYLKGEGVGSIQVQVKESPQHVEVNLTDVEGYEKNVIVELINETNARLSKKSLQCNHENCRAIILYEADKLSADALLHIQWLLERNTKCNKIFFCCNDSSELEPIKSKCTVIRLLPPSTEEIVEVLEFIAKQEGIELPRPLAEKFANKSMNNLRQAIRSFEATWHSNYPFTEDQEIMTGWEDDIMIMAKNIVEEQSPKQLYFIRRKLQNLIDHNVSPKFIFKTLEGELKNLLNEKLRAQIDKLCEDYIREYYSDKPFPSARNQNEEMDKDEGYKDRKKKNVLHFLRIEECIAKWMSRYKISVMTNRGA